jgi:hypothetical protein
MVHPTSLRLHPLLDLAFLPVALLHLPPSLRLQLSTAAPWSSRFPLRPCRLA